MVGRAAVSVGELAEQPAVEDPTDGLEAGSRRSSDRFEKVGSRRGERGGTSSCATRPISRRGELMQTQRSITLQTTLLRVNAMNDTLAGPSWPPSSVAPLAPSPALPSSGPLGHHATSAGVDPIVIVLLVILGLLLLCALEWHCRSLRGMSLCEALRSCLVSEADALITVHPNSVQGAPGYEMGKWRPWRPSPGGWT